MTASTRRSRGSGPLRQRVEQPCCGRARSGGMSSRSLPARSARTAASPAAHRMAGAMFSASVTTTPVKPSSAAQQVDEHLAGEARRHARVDRLHVEVAGHHHAGAGLDARPGTAAGRSAFRASARLWVSTGSASWLLTVVWPWPGKCLSVAATPADCSPRTAAATWARRRRRVGAVRAGADHEVAGRAEHVGVGREVDVDADRGELGAGAPPGGLGEVGSGRPRRTPSRWAAGPCRT